MCATSFRRIAGGPGRWPRRILHLIAVLAAAHLLASCSDDDDAKSTTAASTPATDPALELAAELHLGPEEATAVIEDFCTAATSSDPTRAADHVRGMQPDTAAEVGDILLAITIRAEARCPNHRADLAVVADDVYSAVTGELPPPANEGQLGTVPAP